MTKAGTEYVRGIPVVKIFQQTVYSFKAFQQAIEEYSAKAEHYQADVCRVPQSINLTVTEGAFVFLVPVALFLAPGALTAGNFAGFVVDFAFYAVFSAIISTALARIMFASSGIMLAGTALGRIRMVMDAPELKAPERPRAPQGSRVEFRDVSFTYDGAETPRSQPCVFYSRAGTDRGPGGPLRRRQNHRRQPDPPGSGTCPPARCLWAAWMCGTWTPTRSWIRLPLCSRTAGCSRPPSWRTSGPQGQRPPGSRCSPPSWPPSAETFWKSCQRAWTL